MPLLLLDLALLPQIQASREITARRTASSSTSNGADLVIVPVTLVVGDPTAVTLSGLNAAQASLPAAGLPVAGLALGAAYALRRRQDQT